MSSHLAWIVPPLLRVCLALIVNWDINYNLSVVVHGLGW
jgi:hypothetical protein